MRGGEIRGGLGEGDMRRVAPDAIFTNWIRKTWPLRLRAMSQMVSQALLATRSVTQCGEWGDLATREVGT